VKGSTTVFMLLGSPISHAKAPAMFSAETAPRPRRRARALGGVDCRTADGLHRYGRGPKRLGAACDNASQDGDSRPLR
jgi:hypothetical protein